MKSILRAVFPIIIIALVLASFTGNGEGTITDSAAIPNRVTPAIILSAVAPRVMPFGFTITFVVFVMSDYREI